MSHRAFGVRLMCILGLCLWLQGCWWFGGPVPGQPFMVSGGASTSTGVETHESTARGTETHWLKARGTETHW